MSNSQLEQVRQVGEAIAALGNRMAEVLTPTFQALVPTMQALYGAFWRAYLEAGAPYGETDEGMMRWYKEVGEARRMQFEADRILAHHRMLEQLRQKIAL